MVYKRKKKQQNNNNNNKNTTQGEMTGAALSFQEWKVKLQR